jgi:hypothetical protein
MRGVVRVARELVRRAFPISRVVAVEQEVPFVNVAKTFLREPTALVRTGLEAGTVPNFQQVIFVLVFAFWDCVKYLFSVFFIFVCSSSFSRTHTHNRKRVRGRDGGASTLLLTT